MNFQKFSRNSPFRPPLRKDDIGVNRNFNMNEEDLMNEAEKISSGLLRKASGLAESPNALNMPEKTVINKAESEFEYALNENLDVEAERNTHIAELIEELNFNRTRYEKLLSDHAEEKRYWMNYIKQLEAERDKIKY